MTWTTRPASPWPALARWLADSAFSNLQRAIIFRAKHDDGEQEDFGPNRSAYIDELVTWYGLDPNVPGGVYWCGIFVGRVWADAGAKIPVGFAACDRWLEHAVPIDSVTDVEKHGAAVLYGHRGQGALGRPWQEMVADGWDAKHIGIIAKSSRRTQSPKMPTLTIEGNRGYAGSATNNGLAVDMAPMFRRDVLGIVLPVAA